MIIGKGSIASILQDRDDLVFFASGVSNSTCTDENEYEREFNLLKTIQTDQHVVYFSNLGVYYKNDRYTQHKIDIEEYLQMIAKDMPQLSKVNEKPFKIMKEVFNQ
jgi:hypothetical protein